jgi:membrane protease YdiL (CAAX protease family)
MLRVEGELIDERDGREVQPSSSPPAERRPARLIAWIAFVGVVALVAYGNTLSGAEAPDDVLYRYSTAIALVVQFVLFLGVLLLIVKGLPKRPMFGLVPPPSWRSALGWAAAGLGAIWALSLALSPFLDAGEEQGLLPDEWEPDRLGAFILVGAAITLVGPIVEELVFRGVGFALLEPYGKWAAILGTGLMFGAVHGLLVAFPVLAGFGVVLGWLRWKTGSVYPCIALHATFNGIAIVSVPFVA